MGIFDSPGLKSVPDTSNQQTISPYAQPYVSDLLGKTQAFTDAPTPAYTGQLTAGPSTLQTQAWNGLSGLTLPEGLTEAGANLNAISDKAQNLKFTPVNFVDSYTAPDAYKAINATNQYKAAGNAYKPINVTTGVFNQAAAQQYMNPYIQTALNPQLEALQRQAAINSQGDMAKLAKAGAFGGARQAILQGENQYNLLAQQADLLGKGYNQAYTQAGQQFTADQARALQAKQANIDQAKYAAQLGMTDAQLLAQYGTTAQAANIQQRQFGNTQAMTAAQQDAQAKQAQQAAQQAAKQFGATYGLQGLQAATTAQQAAANAGAQEAQYGLANLQALNKAGTEQQGLNQAALNAQYNEYLRQLKYPQEMLTLQKNILSGLPITTQNNYKAQSSTAQNAAGAAGTVLDLVKKMKDSGMSMPDISKYINNITATSPKQTGGITIDSNGNLVYPTGPDNLAPYDEDGNLMPGFSVDENNNPVWIGSDYVEPDYSSSTSTDTTDTTDNTDYSDWWA
jgi:hypothetical protein